MSTNNTASSTPVYNRYPYVTGYNRWRLIPVYAEGVDYDYWNYKLESSILNGVSVKYDISSMTRADDEGKFPQHNFTTYTDSGMKQWHLEGCLFRIYNDSTLPNKIIFDESYSISSTGGIRYGKTEFKNDNSVIINVYYGSINSAYNNDVANAWKSTVSHEIGHSLGLDHINRSYSIMCQTRDRTTVIAPHNCDIAGVKKNYIN